jgi:hypothetical protein
MMNKATHGEKPAKSAALENEGEGSRTAARRYNDATREFIDSGKVGEAAQKAKEAVDGPEGEELRRAEALVSGKAKPRPPMNTEEDVRRAEAEGMCHPKGPGESN